MDKEEVKFDLKKLQKNYFEAGVENLKLGNELNVELSRQLLESTTFLLIFIATIFFFLESKLASEVVGMPLYFWLDMALGGGGLSILAGIWHLSAAKTFLIRTGQMYFRKSKDVNDRIEKTRIIAVDTIPDELKMKDGENDASPSKKVNSLLTIQIAFLIVSLASAIIPIILVIR